MDKYFTSIANAATRWFGSPIATILAFVIVLVWIMGLFFVTDGVKNTTYEFLINTGTTIATFVMIFVVQHTTNIGNIAIQKKLDIIIKSIDNIPNKFVGIETKTEKELDELGKEIAESLTDQV